MENPVLNLCLDYIERTRPSSKAIQSH